MILYWNAKTGLTTAGLLDLVAVDDSTAIG